MRDFATRGRPSSAAARQFVGSGLGLRLGDYPPQVSLEEVETGECRRTVLSIGLLVL